MNDELLIKFLLRETSEEENTAVQEWLAASQANLDYFIQFEKIWEAGKALAPVSKADPEIAWQKFKARTAQAAPATLIQEAPAQQAQTSEAIVRPLKKNYAWMKIAATILLAIGVWAAYQTFGPSTYTPLTAKAEVITKTLPDGSEIILNKNTEISYASNFSKNRKVRLKSGDIFFNVAPDQSHPFVIEINKVSVVVLGTSFNIRHRKGQTEVIVESGMVKVSQGNEEIKLGRGERLLVSNTTQNEKLVKTKNTDQLYSYYRSKLFVVNNTPLWKLAETLSEAYGVTIIVDPSAREKTLNTTLKMGSLEDNLQIICQSLNIHQTRNGEQILLSNRK